MTPLEIQILQTHSPDLKSDTVSKMNKNTDTASKLNRRTIGLILVTLILTMIGYLFYWLTKSLALGAVGGVVPYSSYKIGKWISGILKQDYDYRKPMF